MNELSFSSSDPFFAARSIPSVDGVGFMHNRLDRDTEHRTADSIPTMMAEKTAGFYLFHKDTLVIKPEGESLKAIFDKESALALGANVGNRDHPGYGSRREQCASSGHADHGRRGRSP